MQLLNWSLGDAAAELALDEALLESAEAGERVAPADIATGDGEILRLWQFDHPVVVIGRGSRIDGEANRVACQADGVPVLRRCSGGAAIVGGPGCLMYSLILSCQRRPQLRRIDEVHRWVMTRLVDAIHRQCPQVQWQGTCDLTLDGRKFSGNSLKVARNHVLYHGTILHAFDLPQIARWLNTPPRQPDYRAGRSHGDFVTNLSVDAAQLADDLATVFAATQPPPPPQPRTAKPSKPLGNPSEASLLGHLARYGHMSQYGHLADERLRRRLQQLLESRYRQAAWHQRH